MIQGSLGPRTGNMVLREDGSGDPSRVVPVRATLGTPRRRTRTCTRTAPAAVAEACYGL